MFKKDGKRFVILAVFADNKSSFRKGVD